MFKVTHPNPVANCTVAAVNTAHHKTNLSWTPYVAAWCVIDCGGAICFGKDDEEMKSFLLLNDAPNGFFMTGMLVTRYINKYLLQFAVYLQNSHDSRVFDGTYKWPFKLLVIGWLGPGVECYLLCTKAEHWPALTQFITTSQVFTQNLIPEIICYVEEKQKQKRLKWYF